MNLGKRSVPRRQPSTSKTIQPIQLKSAEQCEPDFTEKSSTGSRSNDSSAHCHSKGTFVTMAESLRKSNWDGFAEPCHRAPSTLRTPSPCTQNSDVSKSMMGIIGHSPVELHRKRNGNGSFSIGSKRSRHLSPVFVDHVTYRDSGTLVGQGGLNDTYQDLTRPRTREPTAEELKHSEVIILSDCDDGDDEILEITSGKWFSRPKKNVTRQLTIDDLVIDLDEQEDLFDREHEELVSREELILELHQEDHRESTRSLIEPPRNLPITHPWTSKNTISTGVGTIKHESFVELKSHNFLRIAMILKNPTSGEIRLRGHRLERTKNLNGRLPRKLNELCWIVEIDLDDVRLSTEQDMVEINVDDIIGLRDLRITNQLFPSCSFRETGGFYNEWDAEHKAHCTARWKYSCTYDTAKDRRNNKWIEKCLEHLHNGDLYGDDRGRFTVSDTGLRFSYRGETVLGGAYGGPEQSNGKRSSAVINVDDEDGPNPCDEIDLTEDDEAEFERIRRSVSVMGLSNKAGQVSSNIGCRDSYNKAPPQTNTQNHCTRQLPQSINLLGSEIIAPPRIGSICAQDTGFVFESVNQLVRLPGQKYTYGDGCKPYLNASLRVSANHSQSVEQVGPLEVL
jgi:hypothetical protein